MITPSIEVYEYGTEVTIKLLSMKGIITACTIRMSAVCYEVVYFDTQAIRQVIWIQEGEFETTGQKKGIGFRPGKDIV